MPLAWRLARNEADAKDLVQEASRRAICHLKQYDQTRSLSAWFNAILRNLFTDERKSHAARNAVSLDAPLAGSDEALDLSALVPEREGGILECLERRETVELVRRTLSELNEHHRDVLTLCDMEGMPYRDAAREIGIPEGTIRSRLHRARIAFREQYLAFTESGFPEPSLV